MTERGSGMVICVECLTPVAACCPTLFSRTYFDIRLATAVVQKALSYDDANDEEKVRDFVDRNSPVCCKLFGGTGDPRWEAVVEDHLVLVTTLMEAQGDIGVA